MVKLPSLAVSLLCICKMAIATGRTSYAVWAADSAIARRQGNGLDANENPIVSYEHGEFQWGLRQLYERTGNTTYFDYIKQGIDNIVFSNGTVHGSYVLTDYVLDPLRTGPTMIYLHGLTQNKTSKYKIAADTFRSQLDSHPRTTQGQFWHKLKYPNQGWLDGIYMGEIFYASYTSTFQLSNDTAWDDITNQFVLMFQNTIQNATAPNNTGLMYHGYDHSGVAPWASADRGHSPEVWDRALGWYSMALVDILDIMPQSHPGYSRILSILQLLVPRIQKAADPTSGAWWLVMTQPGRTKNYFESSGTAMFVYALLKAVRLGHVYDEDGSILLSARKAYEYMVNNWVVVNPDGTMNWLNTVIVGSLDTTGDFDYYVSQVTDVNDLKGVAAFLLASLEFERLPISL
ncbi:Unsaturated rhamnogalacturonyl hydrolase YteR [Psilocybe cubensis]|uniref:Unsaturated rhamnogalacturonyl hydrolase YteR n=2 Tax=Psilocybe cubensis TaxID=181762 RepID=A0ACB8H3L9_PSICU|nr:Unsaturated rhamnogalacturonyl hydrolase YteR [Psilocybe cubensis]KAH9481790.1 Unsaturated rhamnogalacturonyl hydrolase YteR [Psilocybe cubensis]